DAADVCSPRFADGDAVWLAARLYRAHRTGDDTDALLFDLLGACARMPRGCAAPGGLPRAVDLIRSEFREPLRSSQIAARSGVHPVHLARVYRRFHGESLADCLHRLRVQHAARLLTNPDLTLAAIGAESGFADQSHFIRTFRQLIGTTPGEFRQLLVHIK